VGRRGCCIRGGEERLAQTPKGPPKKEETKATRWAKASGRSGVGCATHQEGWKTSGSEITDTYPADRSQRKQLSAIELGGHGGEICCGAWGKGPLIEKDWKERKAPVGEGKGNGGGKIRRAARPGRGERKKKRIRFWLDLAGREEGGG